VIDPIKLEKGQKHLHASEVRGGAQGVQPGGNRLSFDGIWR